MINPATISPMTILNVEPHFGEEGLGFSTLMAISLFFEFAATNMFLVAEVVGLC